MHPDIIQALIDERVRDLGIDRRDRRGRKGRDR